ncbi:hypothetical protein KRX57_05340 [Weeksellaceae bacterium TAE3-ERU29]|nr:hypothetical protein [Weeksellaceae bacterium TAE3-ERU29]
MSDKYTLKFMLEYECNTLWANDEKTEAKFGYHIDDLTEVGLSLSTIKLNNIVKELYYLRLNPIYPGFPSFWSAKMHLFFQEKVRNLYQAIIKDTKNNFKVIVPEFTVEELNEEINSEKIDIELDKFINNPTEYCNKHSILFNNRQDLEKEIMIEYRKWKIKEENILKKANCINE